MDHSNSALVVGTSRFLTGAIRNPVMPPTAVSRSAEVVVEVARTATSATCNETRSSTMRSLRGIASVGKMSKSRNPVLRTTSVSCGPRKGTAALPSAFAVTACPRDRLTITAKGTGVTPSPLTTWTGGASRWAVATTAHPHRTTAKHRHITSRIECAGCHKNRSKKVLIGPAAEDGLQHFVRTQAPRPAEVQLQVPQLRKHHLFPHRQRQRLLHRARSSRIERPRCFSG